MITSELISYIKKQIKNNISNDVIISKLTEAGWHRGDIDEGFFNVHLESKPETFQPDVSKEIVDTNIVKETRKTLDQYREPLTEEGIVDIGIKKELPKIEIPNKEFPIAETPITDILKAETPKVETPKMEVFNIEMPTKETPIVESSNKIEIPIIETPKEEISVAKTPVIESSVLEMPIVELPVAEKYDIEIPNIETPVSETSKEEVSIGIPVIAIPFVETPVAEKYDIEIPDIEIPEIEVSKEEVPINKMPTEEVQILETKKEIPTTEIKEAETHDIEIFNLEISQPETIKETKIDILTAELPKIETKPFEKYKIWTPMKAPIKEIIPTEEQKVKTEIIIQNKELLAKEEEVLNDKSINIDNMNETPELIKPKDVVNHEELLPTLMPKMVVDSFGSINKTNITKPEEPTAFVETSKNFLFNNLPKTAMLSSYENDFSSISKEEKEINKKKSFKAIKWIIGALILLFLIAGTTWAFISGYINIENIPFVKKDPKILLLNNSKVLSSLKSYKTETNIEISSPSFANITSGIISGEVVPSLDEDFISISTQGLVNQNEQGILSGNSLTVKSSFFLNDVTADIKNNNSDLFLTVSDLSQIIKESSSEPQTIKINEEQFNLIPSLFPPEVELELKKINLYKILSNGMLSYINNETLNVYDEFINNVKITEKGQENIKGIDTYHYTVNTDRQLIKKLLTKVTDDFTLELSVEDRDKLNEILGSVTVESFEVWVGKGDNNIYQYNVVLNAPLSKILSFEDKSIGDNKVKFSWKTTFYDFNISNDISTPENSTNIIDFVKTIKEEKIKNDVSTFRQLATSLFNAEGVYGKISNLKGSCILPASGSLFSPLGHSKGSSTAVSYISELLNKVLKTTNNNGFCYSTSKAWSFTIPVSDNYDIESIPEGGYKSYFCIDNTGAALNLITPPTDVVCK